MPIPSLTLENLTLPKERSYLTFVIVISVLAWLLIAITLIGIFYGAMIALFIWLANGLLIAHLRSESVLVTEEQMPALYRTYLEVVAQLQIEKAPPLYVVQSNGVLNAFATRHSGRDFVVIYSDMLEACGADTPQIRFILGHELGHVRRQHIKKKMLLFPGLLTPLLGNAYSRACEASCDRHGAFAAGDMFAAAQAMLILSGGKSAWQQMDPLAFSRQYKNERGFFVSWHELTSGYPTLSQRTSNLLTLDLPEPVREPRHPMAYLFALFTAGGRHGSSGNMLVTVAVVAMLAAIAVPAFENARQQAEITRELSQAQIKLHDAPTPSVGAVIFSASISPNHSPIRILHEIPAGQETAYATIVWKLVPGRHVVTLDFQGSSGISLEKANYIINPTQDIFRSWQEIDLTQISPRPLSTTVVISLDGKQLATKMLHMD